MSKWLPTLLLILLAWNPASFGASARRSRSEGGRSSRPGFGSFSGGAGAERSRADENRPSPPPPNSSSSGATAEHSGADANLPSGSPFDAFRIVYDRNIFSANRRAGRSVERPTTETISRPVQTEQIVLTGAFIQTMGSVRECVAFFEGSKAEYNTTRSLGGSIAGYRIAEIRTEGVRLVQNDERIEIPVGCGLSRQGEGKWQVASASNLAGRRAMSSSEGRRGSDYGGRRDSNSRSRTSPGTPSAPTGEAAKSVSTDEILKKLMERRQQEAQK